MFANCTVYMMMVIFGHEQANFSCIRTVVSTHCIEYRQCHARACLKFMIIIQLLAGKRSWYDIFTTYLY